MNRSGLVFVGMAIAILGYALVWSAWTGLHPDKSPTGEGVGLISALVPGRVKTERAKAA